MPDLTAYTHALFNGDNRMKDIGEGIGDQISKQVYGMAQAKAQRLIKDAGAQIESVLIGEGEAAKYKKAILETAGEGLGIAVGGGALGLGALTKGFLTAIEAGWNIHRVAGEGDDPAAQITPGAYVIIHNGFVPTTRGPDGRPVRAKMQVDAAFENTFNDFAVFGQTPDIEMGEGFERMADVSYGFFIEDVDGHSCKVYNFELARPQDVERRHVMLVDEGKQETMRNSPVNAIKNAYFQAEQPLIVGNRLSVDPGAQVYEKNDPSTPYTVVKVVMDNAVIVPESGGNQKFVPIEHLRPGRQEHTTQYNYGESVVNVNTPQGRVPVRTGCYLWFKLREGLVAQFRGQVRSNVEIAILRDLDAQNFQVVYAFDGAAVQYDSKTFYSSVIPFSDGDREMILQDKNFQRFKAKVMDSSLRNWSGYAPGQVSSTLAAVSLGHLQGKPNWHENLIERQRAMGALQRGQRVKAKIEQRTVVGERAIKNDIPRELDTAEELAALGIGGVKPVDILYGERETFEEEPAPLVANPTNGALGLLAGAVLVGGYLMTQ